MWLIVAGFALVLLACLLSDYWWFAELFVHWQLHIAAAAVITAFFLLFQRHFATAIALCVIASLFAGTYLPLLKDRPRPLPGENAIAETFRVLQWNVLYKNDTLPQAIPALLRHDADILVLQEISAERAAELQPLINAYPWHSIHVNPKRPAFGMAIFSRLPVLDHDYLPIGKGPNHYTRTVITTEQGRVVHLYEMHLKPPVRPSFAAARDAEMKEMALIMQNDKHAYRLLLGDLNCTLYSPRLQWLMTTAGLYDAQQGFRMEGTWPHILPRPLRIGIDRLLASDLISIASRSVGEYLGSDHLPVQHEIALYYTYDQP